MNEFVLLFYKSDPCACLADFPLVGDAVDRSCTKSSAVECTGDLKFPTDPELGKVAEFTGAEGRNHLTVSKESTDCK